MAHAILIKGGGGGTGGSDEVTVHQKDIPKGLTAITADSNDEVVEGSLETTASDSKVLAGETYYNTSTYDKRTGTMPNYAGNTKTAKSVTANGSNIDVTINNAGYYTDESKVQATMSSVANAGGLTAAKMLGGQTAFGITGTALNDATISGNDKMLSGVVAYGKNGTKYTGSIASQGSVTFTPSNVAQYGNYKGKYMTGNITVSAVANLTAANILKGKTVGGVAGTATSDATAAANRIMNGYTAYVNGSKITGTVNVQTVVSFSFASRNYSTANFKWQNPAKGPFYGVVVRGKSGSYPTSVSDGSLIYNGYGTNTAPSGTSYSTFKNVGTGNWYFRAYSYYLLNGSPVYHSTNYTANAQFTCYNCSHCDNWYCDDCDDCSDCNRCSDCSNCGECNKCMSNRDCDGASAGICGVCDYCNDCGSNCSDCNRCSDCGGNCSDCGSTCDHCSCNNNYPLPCISDT